MKLSLTGIVAIRESHRVLSAEPLVSSYGTKQAHDSRYPNLCEQQPRAVAVAAAVAAAEMICSELVVVVVMASVLF